MGKVVLRKYSGYFLPEEQKMIDLKHLNKIYDRRVSLGLIPFYKERIEYVQAERDKKYTKGGKKEITLLENILVNLSKDLVQEQDQIQRMAT